jgi:hypothetical protein
MHLLLSAVSASITTTADDVTAAAATFLPDFATGNTSSYVFVLYSKIKLTAISSACSLLLLLPMRMQLLLCRARPQLLLQSISNI